jgi:hypothetical protein
MITWGIWYDLWRTWIASARDWRSVIDVPDNNLVVSPISRALISCAK